MPKPFHIPSSVEELTTATLTTILREKGVIGAEMAVHTLTPQRIGADESFTGGTLFRGIRHISHYLLQCIQKAAYCSWCMV